MSSKLDKNKSITYNMLNVPDILLERCNCCELEWRGKNIWEMDGLYRQRY